MPDEGYVKYKCHWRKSDPAPAHFLPPLNFWRDRLYNLGLIGAYPDGIGFGNLSTRIPGSAEFIITGTATGKFLTLAPEHYSRVRRCDLAANTVYCEGPVQASSEALTHAAIYEARPTANAVLHVHHLDFWEKNLNHLPTTSPDVTYGTPEMAAEIKRLFAETDLAARRICVMAGHREGIIAFGDSIDLAGAVLLEHFPES